MSRFIKFSLLGLMAAAGACNSADLVVDTEVLPYAGVRFINAVPDSAGTFGMDFRFVDLLESNAHFRIAFRNNPSTNSISSQIEYKGAREGNRHFKVFLDDTVNTIASTVVFDGNIALTKGHNYTVMAWGEGRSTGANAMHLDSWEEDVADPGDGKIALRVINTTPNAIDAWIFPVGGTASATPTWDAVPAYSRSSYVVVDSGSYRYQIRNDGSATNLVTTATALTGIVATCGGSTPTASNPSGCKTGEHADIEAIPGTKVAGSAVTAIVWPRSTAGSNAPQATAFQSPAMTFMWDRRPPRICDPWC